MALEAIFSVFGRKTQQKRAFRVKEKPSVCSDYAERKTVAVCARHVRDFAFERATLLSPTLERMGFNHGVSLFEQYT